MAEGKCPICKSDAKFHTLHPYRDGINIACSRCGYFELFPLDLAYFEQTSDRSLFPYLSAYIRQNSGPDAPLVLRPGEWESHALVHQATPVSRKLERALELMAKRSAFPGHAVSFSDEDIALLDAAHRDEVTYLRHQLQKMGFLEFDADTHRDFVTARGWEKLEAHSNTGIPGRCFVAMSFDHSLDEAWEKGIEPALREDCKLDPIRIDKVHHNEKICDKLIAEIRLSQFLVADFTLHRPGVYFEAGFALGLGRPVIWTCRKDNLGNTHFDTRQYNHIDWETPEDLRSRLRDRVIATITTSGS